MRNQVLGSLTLRSLRLRRGYRCGLRRGRLQTRTRRNRTRRRCRLAAGMSQRQCIGRAYVDHVDIAMGKIRPTDNVRNQREYNFVLRMFGFALRKKIFQDRNGRQAWNSAQRLRLRVFQHAAQQADFAVLQADFVFNLALSNHRLIDATDAHVRCHRRDVHRQLQTDFPPRMHPRRDVDVYADIEVLKLSIDQRVDTDSANARLERSCRHRHAVTDL